MTKKPLSHYDLTIGEAKKQQQRQYDRDRASDHAFYVSAPWRAARALILSAEPICRACRKAIATEVDHIKPRLEAPELSLDPANLQPLCCPCHKRKSGREWNKRNALVGKQVVVRKLR